MGIRAESRALTGVYTEREGHHHSDSVGVALLPVELINPTARAWPSNSLEVLHRVESSHTAEKSM